METLILLIVLIVSLVANFFMVFIIRGFMKREPEPVANRAMTGREIEELRRKISLSGPAAVSTVDVLNLIKTIRDTHLGTYVDNDPYVPVDPYEDVK